MKKLILMFILMPCLAIAALFAPSKQFDSSYPIAHTSEMGVKSVIVAKLYDFQNLVKVVSFNGTELGTVEIDEKNTGTTNAGMLGVITYIVKDKNGEKLLKISLSFSSDDFSELNYIVKTQSFNYTNQQSSTVEYKGNPSDLGEALGVGLSTIMMFYNMDAVK